MKTKEMTNDHAPKQRTLDAALAAVQEAERIVGEKKQEYNALLSEFLTIHKPLSSKRGRRVATMAGGAA